jgi:hypothetical protein
MRRRKKLLIYYARPNKKHSCKREHVTVGCCGTLYEEVSTDEIWGVRV